jgi:hypothetical protein
MTILLVAYSTGDGTVTLSGNLVVSQFDCGGRASSHTCIAIAILS